MRTYANAEEFCASNGMKLFVMDNAETRTLLESAIGPLYKGSQIDVFFINGKSDADGKFFTSPPKTPLASDLSYDGENLCLRVSLDGPFSPWTTGVLDCTTNVNFICEY